MKSFRIAVPALLVLVSAIALAGPKGRCRVKVNDEFRLIDKTYTEGGCRVEAKKVVEPVLCTGGNKKFEFKYMFDGHISTADGYCR